MGFIIVGAIFIFIGLTFKETPEDIVERENMNQQFMDAQDWNS